MDESYKKALKLIYYRLKDSGVNWAIFGSANLLLQGLPVKPNDIDILTDEIGAYKIEKLFLECIVKKVIFCSNGKVQSHYGAFDIDGVKVEIIGDFRSSIDKDLKPIAELKNTTKFVQLDSVCLSCLTLENEYISYKNLDRLEKIELVGKWLNK